MTIEITGDDLYESPKTIKNTRTKEMSSYEKFEEYISKHSDTYKIFDGRKYLTGIVFKKNYFLFIDYSKKDDSVTGFSKLNIDDNFIIDEKELVLSNKSRWVFQTEENVEEYILDFFLKLEMEKDTKNKTNF
tara:strand:+ start:233 stop:628 length:396 start_codon:yes stop_codon:yes gene_type:complete